MSKEKLILGAIIILAIVLRFWNLGRIPIGFIPEEVSTGWNAYSLLKTGKDEWGTFLPLIFRETGGYKLVLNSYLIVPVMAVLGVTEFAVRTPVAFAGVLSVFLTYFLAKELFKKESVALAASLLLAISPWHISMGRYAVDVNWGVPLFILGLLLLLKSRYNHKLMIVSAVSFGLTYYTYFNYDVFTVLFLAGLLLWQHREFFTVQMRTITMLFILIQALFWTPYLLSPTLFTRFSQATSGQNIGFTNRINEHREACESTYTPFICRAVYNKVNDKIIEQARRYIIHFSTSTFFLYGSLFGLSGMPDHWGFMYLPEFFLLAFGAYTLIRKQLVGAVLILWFFLAGFPSSLAGEGHVWRMLTFLPLPQLIGAVGFISLVKLPRLRLLGQLIVIAGLGFGVMRFWADYTAYFPYAQARNSYFGFRDVYAFVKPIEDTYDAIIVSAPNLGFEQLYIYYAFYMQPNPKIVQTGNGVERTVGDQGWVKVGRIGKWYFEPDPRNLKLTFPAKTLVITDGKLGNNELTTDPSLTAKDLHSIYYPNGDVAFRLVEFAQLRK